MDRGRRSFGASGEAQETDSVTTSRFASTIASGLVDALESPPQPRPTCREDSARTAELLTTSDARLALHLRKRQ